MFLLFIKKEQNLAFYYIKTVNVFQKKNIVKKSNYNSLKRLAHYLQ